MLEAPTASAMVSMLHSHNVLPGTGTLPPPASLSMTQQRFSSVRLLKGSEK